MPDYITSILEGIFGSVVYDLLLAGLVAALLAYLRAKRPNWAPTALYAVVGFTAVWVVAYVFVGHALLLRRTPTTTSENIEANVRAWSDAFGIGIQKQENPGDFSFLLGVHPVSGRVFLVGKQKERDHFLVFETTLVMSPDKAALLEKLSKKQNQQIFDEVILELARARVHHFITGPPIKKIVLLESIPISDALTQDSFLSHLDDMEMASVLAEKAVALAMERVAH